MYTDYEFQSFTKIRVSFTDSYLRSRENNTKVSLMSNQTITIVFWIKQNFIFNIS